MTKRKIFRGLYCLALTLVTLGAVCLLPTLRSNKSEPKTDAAISSSSVVANGKTWTEAYADGRASAPSFTTVARPDGTFYQIGTKEQLAYVAFQVSIEESTDWASRNYELTDDIDLSGSLWTPVGTGSNPFTGIFNGGRHTISGLRIAHSSMFEGEDWEVNFAGLFSFVENSLISDFTISDFNYIDDGDATGVNTDVHAASLIGSAGKNTTIANVYDIRDDKTTFPTIYWTTETVQIYRGGSRDGVTAHYTTTADIENTVTVGDTNYTSGFAIQYNLGDSKVYNAATFDKTKSYDENPSYEIVGALVDTSLNETGREKANWGKKLVSRTSAMSANSGHFAVNPGNEFVAGEATVANGLVSTLTWTPRNYTVNLNYGYGNPTARVQDVNVGNDYPWSEAVPESWFTNSPVNSSFDTYRRKGYTFAGRAFGSASGSAVTGYVGDSTGLTDTTYDMYLSWTSMKDIAGNINIASTVGDTGFTASDAIRELTITEDSTGFGTNLAAGEKKDSVQYTKHDADKQIVIKFKLNAGYKFAANTANPVRGVTSTLPAMSEAGIYLVAAAANYDSYDVTNYSISTDADGFTIVTIGSVVGATDINLAFEREEYEIALKGENVSWALSELSNAKGATDTVYTVLDSANNKLTTRVGEHFKLTATATEGKYISSYKAVGFANLEGSKSVAGVYYKQNLTDSDTTPDHAKAYSYAYSATGYQNEIVGAVTSDNHYIEVKAIDLKVYINLSLKLDNTNAPTGYEDVATKPTVSSAYNQVTGQNLVEAPINIPEDAADALGRISVDGTVSVYMTSSEYYKYDSVKLNDSPASNVNAALQENGFVVTTLNFAGRLKDGEDIPTYNVEFTAVPQTYNVYTKALVDFGDGNYVEISKELIQKWFTSQTVVSEELIRAGSVGKMTASPTDTTTFAFNLTTEGGYHLVLKGYETEKIVDESKNNSGINWVKGEISDSDYTFGTSDTYIVAKYVFKRPHFDFNENEMYVLDVNGNTGKDVAKTNAGVAMKDKDGQTITNTDVNANSSAALIIGNDIVSIDIPTGYYFVGWYLKNGNTYTLLTNNGNVGLSDALTSSTIVGALNASTSEVTEFVLVPAVRQKKITLSFNMRVEDGSLESVNKTGVTSQEELITVTYYHEQEIALYNDNTAQTGYAFSAQADLIKKIASKHTGWTTMLSETIQKEYLDNGYFVSSDWTKEELGLVWGDTQEGKVSFYSTWQALDYTASIYAKALDDRRADQTSELLGTITMRMGDTIIATPSDDSVAADDGKATFVVMRDGKEVEGSTVTIAGERGMRVIGFLFGSKHLAGVSESVKADGKTEYSFTLDEGNIRTFLDSTLYYEGDAYSESNNAFTIVPVKEAKTFKLYIYQDESETGITLNSSAVLKTDGLQKYVEVTFGQNPSNLAEVDIRRPGYSIDKWIDTINTNTAYATREVSTWNYIPYDYNSDRTARVVWKPNANAYINVETTDDVTVKYIGLEQELATATVTTDGSDADLTAVLSNGDLITAEYWAKVEVDGSEKTYTKVYDGTKLTLTNVSESGTYVFVVEYRDTYHYTANKMYDVKSDEITITIEQNELAISDWDLKAYYNGTNNFVEATGNNYGSINVKERGEEAGVSDKIGELVKRNKVEIVDADRKYTAKEYVTARYYLNIDDEVAKNFSGLNQVKVDEVAVSGQYYIELTANETNKIAIVPTPVTVTLSGRGFYISDTARHTANAVFASGVEGIDFSALTFSANVLTESGAKGAYTPENTDGFAFTYGNVTVTTASGDPISADNFEFTYTGKYDIVEPTDSNAYIYKYTVGYLMATNGQLSSVATNYTSEVRYTLTIDSLTVGETSVLNLVNGKEFYSHVVDGVTVFTVYGNGTAGLSIIINKTYKVGFSVSVSNQSGANNLGFLGWQAEQEDVNGYAPAFATASSASTTTSVAEANTSFTGYALYTDLKEITLNYNANAAMTASKLYLTAGVAMNIADPEWTGFEFAGWTTTNANLVLNDKVASGTDVTATAGSYTQADLQANWNIEEPDITAVSTTITDTTVDSNLDSANANKTIAIKDVLVAVEGKENVYIANQNDSDIRYTYTWSVSGNGESISLPRVITSNGTYTLTVTATSISDSTKTASKTVNFTVAFAKSTIAIDSITSGLKYNGLSQNADITVSLIINGDSENKKDVKLADYLANGTVPASGKNFGFVITYKANESATEQTVTEIKNAGFYSISLVVNDNVYAESSSSASTQVAKFDLELTDAMMQDSEGKVFTKSYGTNDPVMTKTITTAAGNVDVTFVRADGDNGQDPDTYHVIKVNSVSDTQNFDVTIAPDAQTQGWLYIDQMHSNLRVELANALDAHTYSGEAVDSISVEYDVDTKTWTLKIQIGSKTISSALKLYYMLGDSYVPLTDAMLPAAFGNTGAATFSFVDASGAVVTAKNAGVYKLKGDATKDVNGFNYDAIEFVNEDGKPKAELVISKAKLTVSGITKEFDTTSAFTATAANIAGIVGSEKVVVSGTFVSQTGAAIETVGTHNLTFNALTGDDAANYEIDMTNSSATGVITKSTKTITVATPSKTIFVYGDITNATTLAELTILLGGLNLTVADLANGANYITISGFTITGADYSTISGALKYSASAYTVTLTLTSTEFEDSALQGVNTFTITVGKKDVSVGSVTISKPYDGTNALPTDAASKLSAALSGVLSGDEVSVDVTDAKYNSANVNSKIVIDGLKITGADAENYNYIGAATAEDRSVYGSITELEITLNITNPEFVDGVAIEDKTIKIAYNGDSENFLTALANNKSSHKGYKAIGFTYEKSGVATEIKDDFTDFLAAAVAANKTGGLTITSTWEIEKYTLNITVANATVTKYIVGEPGETVTTATEFDYFTKLKVTVLGNDGYKFKEASFTAGTATLTESGKGTRSEGVITFNLLDDSTLNIAIDKIVITVKVNTNVPTDTQFVSGTTSDETLDFSVESNRNASVMTTLNDRNITVTADTYTLTDWFGKDGTTVGAKTWAQILGIVDEDMEVTFTAQWTGVEYTITFDAKGGTFASDAQTTTTARFGSEIAYFPEVTKEGMNHSWNTAVDAEGNATGTYYTATTKVGEINADHEFTLYAIWGAGEYTLSVVLGDNLSKVTYNGEEVTSSFAPITIEFGKEVTLNVTPNSGYNVKGELVTNDGSIDITNGRVIISGSTLTVKNLSANATLTISGEAKDNTLTVVSVNATTASTAITAKTGEQKIITFTAKTGYKFTDSSNVVITGSYDINEKAVISEDGMTLTYTWKGFTADATITVTAQANNNTVAFTSGAEVESLTMNGSTVALTHTYENAKTGETLTVVVTLKYGYSSATLTITGGNSEINQTLKGTPAYNEDGLMVMTFEITDYNQGFSIQIENAVARTYNVQVKTVKPDGTSNGFKGEADKTSYRFGETVKLTATTPDNTLRFIGWFVGDRRVASDAKATLILDEKLKTALENKVDDVNTLVIEARFAESMNSVDLILSGKGTAKYAVGDDEAVEVTDATTTIENLDMTSKLTVILMPNKGYDVASIVYKDLGGNTIVDTTANGWYDETTKTITIDFATAGIAISAIEVTYIPGDATINVRTGVEINYQVNWGVKDGGTITWVDENGDPKDSSITDANFTVNTKTENKEYFLLHKNGNYEMILRSETEGVIINRIKEGLFNGDKALYEVDGIAGEVSLDAVFKALDSKISIYFDYDGQRVYAGSISVDESNPRLVVSGNDSGDVQVSALTGAAFEMTVYANFSYSFARAGEGVAVSNPDGNVVVQSGVIALGSDENIAKGYTENVKITVNDIKGNATIIIHVNAKAYTVRLKSEGSVVSEITGVTYGQEFDRSLAGVEKVVPDARKGYTFNGYYTKQIGQGKQYISNLGAAVSIWNETGYIWNGSRYVAQEGYLGNDTFDLYASWTFDKQKIYLDIIPDELKDTMKEDETKMVIADFIPSLKTKTSWTTVENLLYAEVLTEDTMTLLPYKFTGYTFDRWDIYEVNSDGTLGDFINSIFATGEHKYDTHVGTIKIKAIYKANYEITIYNSLHNKLDADCGDAYIEQNGVRLEEGAYDTQSYVTLVAKEAKGYEFFGWWDAVNGDYLRDINNSIIKGSPDGNGVWKYTFTTYLTKPLTLQAHYMGTKIGVIVDLTNFRAQHGTVESVSVNGLTQNYLNKNEFEARIGDIITIKFQTINRGFGVKFGNLVFSGQEKVYTYKISGEDVKDVLGYGHDQLLTINVEGDPKPIVYNFELRVEGNKDENELALAGYLSYIDTNGNIVKINKVEKNEPIETRYGTEISIMVNLEAYYRIGNIYLNNFATEVTEIYRESLKEISLNSMLLDQYADLSAGAKIIVNIQRKIWIDELYRSKTPLAGGGTEENPYRISSAEEMAYVAYAVNSGLVNDANNIPYADAVYNITRNLDFSGKYWEPIGTEAHPFNGVMNFGSNWFKGIMLYKDYPETAYENLMGKMTPDAKVNVSGSNVLVIALSVVGGVILLVAIILLIIFLTRRARKKKREELENS